MTPEAAVRRLDRFADDLEGVAKSAIGEAQGAAFDLAVWWSSGPLSPAAQRRMGGPYARAERGQARPDPGRINIGKTRAVVEGWAIGPITPTATGWRGSVFNIAPEAPFLYDTSEAPAEADRGTKYMVGRPLPVRVLAELEGPFRAALDRRLDMVMGG